jgi:phosphatidate cytidylyltransferase
MRKGLSNLIQRVLFAVPAAVLFIWITWLGGWFFKGMLIVIGFFIIKEIIRMLDAAGSPVDNLFPYTIGLWVMLFPNLPFAFEIGTGIFLAFATLQTFNSSAHSINKLTGTLFAGLYSSLGLLCLIQLSEFGIGRQGAAFALLLIGMVWGNDIFAYFGGKTYGKHPLAKDISPNKTWEGFLSGFAGSTAAGYLVYIIVPVQLPVSFMALIPMAILVGIFGPIGDLLESKMKRKAGFKDSSRLLPGHGGFFDRFDALILAAPAAYIYLSLLEALEFFSM